MSTVVRAILELILFCAYEDARTLAAAAAVSGSVNMVYDNCWVQYIQHQRQMYITCAAIRCPASTVTQISTALLELNIHRQTSPTCG